MEGTCLGKQYIYHVIYYYRRSIVSFPRVSTQTSSELSRSVYERSVKLGVKD